MHYSIDGLVIKEIETGENDKRITLLTAKKGKVTVSAKGAKSLKSKYMNIVELFTYGNYEITERNGYSWLGGGSVIEPFYKIRDNIDRLSLAAYIVDIAGELSGEEYPADELLRLTLNTLFAIATDMRPAKQIKATFELRAMAISGYLPSLDSCDICGSKKADFMYLDIMNGVLRCEDCIHKLSTNSDGAVADDGTAVVIVPMSYGAVSLARYVIQAAEQKILSVTVEEKVLDEFSKMAETYLLHHLEKKFPSLDFYNSVKNI